jgi:hypothetical protein
MRVRDHGLVSPLIFETETVFLGIPGKARGIVRTFGHIPDGLVGFAENTGPPAARGQGEFRSKGLMVVVWRVMGECRDGYVASGDNWSSGGMTNATCGDGGGARDLGSVVGVLDRDVGGVSETIDQGNDRENHRPEGLEGTRESVDSGVDDDLHVAVDRFVVDWQSRGQEAMGGDSQEGRGLHG